MKKKLIAISLVVALLAVGIVGATLAYFTDEKKAQNDFAMGGVSIDLIEQERKYDEDGNLEDELGDFTQDQTLYPIVGSAQGEKDDFGQPVAENYIDKIVTVKNTEIKGGAWVRAYFAIPSALDDGFETYNAGMNVLHVNTGNYYDEADGKWYTCFNTKWLRQHQDANGAPKWNYFETTIDGIKYNVYYGDYYQILNAGDTTEQFICGVYLDKSVDCKNGEYYAFGDKLELDEGWDWSTDVNIKVAAVAVQAAGFDNAADAVTAAFGAQYNPFADNSTNWQ